jgi:DNA replication protein DnaC
MAPTGPPVITTAGSPRASALAFHGPSGVGKSSLAACLRERRAERAARRWRPVTSSA